MAIAKLGQVITAYGFKGMNNLPEAAAKLLDRERQITPQVVLNADVTDGGVIQARGGYVLTKALANCHSLAGEESGLSVMLCVASRLMEMVTLVSSPDPAFPVLFFNGISNGIVVGQAYAADYSLWKGVIYQNGIVTLVDSPDPDLSCLAFKGVDNGVVAGFASDADGLTSKGAIYQNGVVTLIDSPDPDFPILLFFGVGDGIAVGYAEKTDLSGEKGAIYQNGVVTLIPPPDIAMNYLYLLSISDGIVVGVISDLTHTIGKGVICQYVGGEWVVTLIESPDPTVPILYISSISNGIAVGFAYNADRSIFKGAIYQDSVVTLIDSPNSDVPFLQFNGISDGVAVGYAYNDDDSIWIGVIYQNGVMTLIPSPDPAVPYPNFIGISDGVAVGYAYNFEGTVAKGAICQNQNGPQALYQVEGVTATELCEVIGPRARVSYAEINNVIYASNPYWKATYNLLTGTVSSWGVPLPPAPDIVLVAGDLPPGTYFLCYTNVVGGRLGGNGPLTKIKWEGGVQGILLRNLPTGALCWITHPNGEKLFLAPISGGVVSGQSPYMKPLPSFMVQSPPGFTHFIYAFGRIWGALEKKVYYSDPHQYEWFRPANFFPFLEDVVLVAPTTGGLFVNSLKNTWYLEGTDPAKMDARRVGNGAVLGTLTMVQVAANIAGGAQTSDIFAQLSKMPTPVWMSPTGFVVGSHGGNLTYLTENRMNIQPRAQGASLYRNVNGIPQVISSLYGLSEGVDDLEEIFTRGRMYIPAPIEVVGSVEIAIS